MSGRPVFRSAAVLGMVVAWRFVSEFDRQRQARNEARTSDGTEDPGMTTQARPRRRGINHAIGRLRGSRGAALPSVDVPAVSVTRNDGSVRRVPVGTQALAAVSATDRARPERRRDHQVAVLAAACVLAALAGLAGTMFALTHPLHALAWPAAGAGLLVVVLAWVFATRLTRAQDQVPG